MTLRKLYAAQLALASVSTLALSAAAQAQQPVMNWSGFYVGANAGYSWGRANASTTVPCNQPGFPTAYFCAAGVQSADSFALAAQGSGALSDGAFTGGVQAGFNWQSNQFVYGAEIDFGAWSLRASRSGGGVFASGINSFVLTTSADTDWLFTARGRVGWTISNLLLYGTGGVAVTRLHTAQTYRDFPTFAGSGSWSGSETKAGWTLGAGAEWAFARNWSLKVEYLYVDFGKIDASGVVTVPGFAYADAINTAVDVTAHIARAGVNFRF